jgi:hypothetical protein
MVKWPVVRVAFFLAERMEIFFHLQLDHQELKASADGQSPPCSEPPVCEFSLS